MFITTTNTSPNHETNKAWEYDNDFMFLEQTKLFNLPRDIVVLLDTNLVQQLENQIDTEWVKWFNEHIKEGQKFYVIPKVANEYSKPLPSGVVLLKNEHTLSPHNFHGIFTSMLILFTIKLN